MLQVEALISKLFASYHDEAVNVAKQICTTSERYKQMIAAEKNHHDDLSWRHNSSASQS